MAKRSSRASHYSIPLMHIMLDEFPWLVPWFQLVSAAWISFIGISPGLEQPLPQLLLMIIAPPERPLLHLSVILLKKQNEL